jgi:hypothetical protein
VLVVVVVTTIGEVPAPVVLDMEKLVDEVVAIPPGV